MKILPRTGASIIVREKNRVLLVKRDKEPYKGFWSLPGGSQETGETLEDTARRELKEETGLDASLLSFCKVRDLISRDGNGKVVFHFVLAIYFAETFSGTPQANDDAADIGWFTLHETNRLETTSGTPEFLVETLGPDFSASFHPD